MPNIYLRMPVSRCQYFRNRDPKQVLAKDQPLVFSNYMTEHFIMRNSLTPTAALDKQVNMACFSQQQWRNMLQGKSPMGGGVIIKRNVEDYLSFDEVQLLNGKIEHGKSVREDYLCIKLPSEVELIDTVRSVTAAWTLGTHGVRSLVTALNNDFKRSLVDWALATFDFCTSRGNVICRAQQSMLERYLMRYGIEPTVEEKDNLRRIIFRWFKTEHVNYTAYSCLDMRFEDRREKNLHIDGILWLT